MSFYPAGIVAPDPPYPARTVSHSLRFALSGLPLLCAAFARDDVNARSALTFAIKGIMAFSREVKSQLAQQCLQGPQLEVREKLTMWRFFQGQTPFASFLAIVALLVGLNSLDIPFAFHWGAYFRATLL